MVFGPILLPALIWAACRWRGLSPWLRTLVVFSLPIILLVCVQALLSRAYANWAAAAYLTGTVAVVLWLLPRARGWLARRNRGQRGDRGGASGNRDACRPGCPTGCARRRCSATSDGSR